MGQRDLKNINTVYSLGCLCFFFKYDILDDSDGCGWKNE